MVLEITTHDQSEPYAYLQLNFGGLAALLQLHEAVLLVRAAPAQLLHLLLQLLLTLLGSYLAVVQLLLKLLNCLLELGCLTGSLLQRHTQKNWTWSMYHVLYVTCKYMLCNLLSSECRYVLWDFKSIVLFGITHNADFSCVGCTAAMVKGLLCTLTSSLN